MTRSADAYILYKIGELARACGLRASDADGELYLVNEDNDPEGKGFYALDFAGRPSEPELGSRYDKFADLLGMTGDIIKVDDLGDLEDIVERALALAPRPRFAERR